jgi:hypothetical protein
MLTVGDVVDLQPYVSVIDQALARWRGDRTFTARYYTFTPVPYRKNSPVPATSTSKPIDASSDSSVLGS